MNTNKNSIKSSTFIKTDTVNLDNIKNNNLTLSEKMDKINEKYSIIINRLNKLYNKIY